MVKIQQFNKKCKKAFCHILPFLVSSLVAYFCSLLFINLINCVYTSDLGEKEIIEPMSKDWFINAFFNHYNKIDSYIEIDDNKEDNIVIINIEQSKSNPKDLAEILKKIGQLNPPCIALDIFMRQDNDSVDSYLTNVLDSLNLHNNIVVASWYDDTNNCIEQSYFNKNERLKSGVINNSNLLDLKNYYKGHTTFATRIAKSLNYDCKIEKKYINNFRLKRIKSQDISTVNEVDYLKMQDPEIDKKIFIIGSTDPMNNNIDLPFVLDYIDQTPGCYILAYELSSLMNLNKKNKYKTPLHEISTMGNLVFCIAALLVYLTLLKGLPECLKYCLKKLKVFTLLKKKCVCIFCKSIFPKIIFILFNKRRCKLKAVIFFVIQNVPGIIFKVLALIGAEIIVIYISFFWTEYFLSIPNIYLFAVSLLFVDEIYKKIKKTTSSYD